MGKHKQVENKQHSIKKNYWVSEEVKEEIRKYMEMNKNKNTTFQNLRHTGKAILRRKFRDTPRDKKKPQINNLSYL